MRFGSSTSRAPARRRCTWAGRAPGSPNRPHQLDAAQPNPRAPENNKPGDITLAPVNGEAVMHRNFIEGASPRGIGVGYPGGINAVWTPTPPTWRCSGAGAFVDVRRHWTDRGGGNIAPLGYDLVKPAPASPALARLETPEATWPGMEGKRIKAIEYRGHQLDAKRFPTYRWETTDLGLAVSETHTPSGDSPPAATPASPVP